MTIVIIPAAGGFQDGDNRQQAHDQRDDEKGPRPVQYAIEKEAGQAGGKRRQVNGENGAYAAEAPVRPGGGRNDSCPDGTSCAPWRVRMSITDVKS